MSKMPAEIITSAQHNPTGIEEIIVPCSVAATRTGAAEGVTGVAVTVTNG